MKRSKIIIAVLLVIAVGLSGTILYREFTTLQELKALYQAAEEQIAQENYEDALIRLQEIEAVAYQDTLSLIKLCQAHIAYEAGDIWTASHFLDTAYWEYQSPEQQSRIDSFTEQIQQACKTQQEEEERKALDNIQNGVPFLGMSEDYIVDTILGSPATERRYDAAERNGRIIEGAVYEFVDGVNIIFKVECLAGYAVEVWDYRENPIRGYVPSSVPEDTWEGLPDEYNADDYNDPEEFYYDNYDEFDGYEDAEGYWDEGWE